MGYEQLNKRGRLYDIDFGRQPCFAFALVCWPSSSRSELFVQLVRSNVFVNFIQFTPFPDPISARSSKVYKASVVMESSAGCRAGDG
jgi:hypothetical protein